MILLYEGLGGARAARGGLRHLHGRGDPGEEVAYIIVTYTIRTDIL